MCPLALVKVWEDLQPIRANKEEVAKKSLQIHPTISVTCKHKYFFKFIQFEEEGFKNIFQTINVDDIAVGNFLVQLQPNQILKEKFELKLQVERNLDRAFCHRVPDVSVNGGLSKIHATIDADQVIELK